MPHHRLFIVTENDKGEIDLASIFRQVDLFQDLPEKALEEIVSFAQMLQFYNNQTIISEGESGSDIFIVVSGKVRIQVESISPYMEIGITKLDAGEVFGEMSLLEEGPRSASAITTEPARVVRIGGSDLKGFIERQPQWGLIVMRNMARIMAHRLKNMNRRMLNYLRARHY